MKIVKPLSLSQIVADLNDGLPWYTSEEQGFPSIQTKYGATTDVIDAIKSHPKMAGLEPASFVEFQIIDDLNDVLPTNTPVIVDDLPANTVQQNTAVKETTKVPADNFDDMALPAAQVTGFDSLL